MKRNLIVFLVVLSVFLGVEYAYSSTTIDGARTVTGTLAVTGHTTFEGVTSTGATGTGKLVYDTSPTISLNSASTVPTGAIPAGTPVLIQTQTASGTPSSITFSSIPGTYVNLKLEITARGDTASQTAGVGAQLNTDTAANYTQDFFSESNAACCNPGQSNGQTSWFFGNMSAASSLANAPGIIVVTIPSYSGTQFLKAFTSNWLDLNGSAITSPRQVGVHGGIWNSTAAITSIKLITSAGNFVNGSVFSLYGQ